ncbi:MAG: type II secretion system protein GspG [Gammaproteobacteria bacterium TMED78]|nr:MAG: type II secretion system protein GspG [Gammaproteobacteria bacterium TMED78]|tara:strand:- start:164 stop:610 length:447 start_codon:yes stop_codon:yes gene_type:complete
MIKKNKLKYLKTLQKGFSLIEIMVVIVIMGLLVAIIAPNVIGNIDRALVARTESDINSIQTALDLFRLDNYRYPATEAGLEALAIDPGDAIAPNWRPYLDRIPLDPWNNTYNYQYPGQRGQFDLYSFGADGQEGGIDLDADIGNWNIN